MFKNYLTKTGKLKQSQPQDIRNQWYIEKCKEVHGTKYNYSLTVFLKTRDNITVECITHGQFSQKLSQHLEGKGCPQCNTHNKLTLEQVICSFMQVHDNIYGYQKVRYTGAHNKVQILCRTHGVFEQTPNQHKQGKGCPRCLDREQSNTVYVIQCLTTGLYKIGITNCVERRLQEIGNHLKLLQVSQKTTKALETEKLLHTKYNRCRLFNSHVKSGGTEFFKLSSKDLEDVLSVIFQL